MTCEINGTDLFPYMVIFTIILTLLKLCGVNITWFWVFSPMWFPFAFALGILAFIGFVFILFIINLCVKTCVKTVFR